MTETQVGAKFTLVSSGGAQLTIQDAAGARYLVATSATDYVPPASPAPAAPAPTVTASPPAGSAQPPPAPVVNPAATPLAPPINPNQTGISIDAATPAQGPSADVLKVTTIAADQPVAVWPPTGTDGRPLLIVAHGHGGSGPHEINAWLKLAGEHQFTVVCPTFKSSISSVSIPRIRIISAACNAGSRTTCSMTTPTSS